MEKRKTYSGRGSINEPRDVENMPCLWGTLGQVQSILPCSYRLVYPHRGHFLRRGELVQMKFPMPFKVLRAVIAFVEGRAGDIRLDIEDFGTLQPVLDWIEMEGILE